MFFYIAKVVAKNISNNRLPHFLQYMKKFHFNMNGDKTAEATLISDKKIFFLHTNNSKLRVFPMLCRQRY